MKCRKCGAEANGKFCDKCGTILEKKFKTSIILPLILILVLAIGIGGFSIYKASEEERITNVNASEGISNVMEESGLKDKMVKDIYEGIYDKEDE